ncbi:MAG: methyl-accepting chemotaxis protein [Spirochaetales bacterium]|nr:methyl-accepting chemotaxis protein [Spirochaetales bacterium]
MSTRVKLMVLVLLTAVAGISSLFINNLMMRPVNRIMDENAVLQKLKVSLIDYVGEANKLTSEYFRARLAIVREKKKALDDSFKSLEGLRYLPSINESIKASVDTILLFANSLSMTQQSFDQRVKVVLDIASRYYGETEEFTVMQLAWGLAMDSKKEVADEVKAAVFSLVSSITAFNRNVQINLENLQKQYDIIDDKISEYTKMARTITSLIIFLVLVVPLLIALLIANVLAGRIKRIDIGISHMKDGDLADRIEVRSRDEMGRLSNNINSFTDELSSSMLQIKQASRNNNDIKESLLQSVGRVVATTDKVNLSAKSITEGMEKLRETIRITDAAGGTVEEQLNMLEAVLNNQVAMVEESTAAITEMIAAVGNVSEIITKKKSVLSDLVEFSRDGGKKLGNTNRIIELIHNSIEQIRGTTKIISGIAGQTNLLAMNAAIEAAHAGDAGRGFAVVASEIRNLAEATTKNSGQINGIMKEVIANIEAAAESGRNTGNTFGKIDTEVSETAAAFDEIVQAMTELKVSGEQILEAMVHLNEYSGQVKDGDASIRDAAEENRKAIESVEAISQVTNSQISEIMDAIGSLAREMDTVNSMTKMADDISRNLEKEVKKFKVAGDTPD